MNKAGWIVALILFIACAYLYTRSPASPPPVMTGITVRVDTVVVHDTIRTVIRGSDFTVRKTLAIPSVADTLKTDLVEIPSAEAAKDSAICYSFSQDYESGAFVQAEMCSRFFPPVRPLDLAGTITYRPGNDTMKLFSRVDTIPKIIYKPPVIPTWQAVTLGIVGGVIIGWVALK